MKRKNLTAKRKAKEKILPVKDSKINQLYQKFEKIVKKNINRNDFAVAVSGGADSLCLSYFSKLYSSKFKNKIYILIVNHNIRKESNKEDLQVKKILINKKIKSEILSWKGKTPKSNIQSNARNFRYLLLSNYCLKKNISLWDDYNPKTYGNSSKVKTEANHSLKQLNSGENEKEAEHKIPG